MMPQRIVVCDDEPHITLAVSMKLKKAGYDVICCADGQAAWEEIQRQLPDLLITDCQMPRMTGLELVRTLRQDTRTADLPVFMLTAKGFELTPELIHGELRILKLILKPFSPRELLQEVDSQLSTRATAGV